MKKKKAIIVDVDGTLATKHEGRGQFDWHLVADDIPNYDIVELVNLYAYSKEHDPYTILVLSGREDICRLDTELWLTRYGVEWDDLFMRAAGDNRKDAIVKREIYDAHIEPYYEVRVVIDDRQQVVDMWRSLGLRVLQVAPGNF